MKQDTNQLDGLFTYEINVAKKLCLVVAKGKITLKLSIRALNHLANTPGFKHDFNIIVDARHINFQPTYREILTLHKHLISKKNHFRNKIALVTTKFFWVVAELISNLSKPHGLQISAFSDMEEAQQWIREDVTEVKE